jgi:hypothetical protein
VDAEATAEIEGARVSDADPVYRVVVEVIEVVSLNAFEEAGHNSFGAVVQTL